MEGGDTIKCVLVPCQQYEELVLRAVQTPEDSKPNSVHKTLARDILADSCVVNMKRSTASAQPQAVQQLMEKTLH